jgi:predicted  nucleic acid-binding Zn-ribbon protein
MNAVTVSRLATAEEDVMPASDDSRDDAARSHQLTGLISDVRHLQSDVTDLKTEVRAVNQRVDSLSDKVDALRDKVDEKYGELRDTIDVKYGELRDTIDVKYGELRDTIDAKYGELGNKVDEKVTGLTQRMDGFGQVVSTQFTDVRKDIASVSDKIQSAKLWAVLLGSSVVLQLVYVIAHGLKWL